MGKKKAKKVSEFEQWAQENAGSARGVPVWMSWPENVRDEIGQVLTHNDSGAAPIARSAYLRRMREKHEISVGDCTLTKYVRVALGRTSWSKK